MISKEWLEFAQIASAAAAAVGLFVAASGLIINALQMSRTRRVADLQALQKFFEHVNEREAALHTTDENERLRAFHEFLNFIELYACAFNEGLFVGDGSRKIVQLKIIDSVIELEHFDAWHPVIEQAIDRSTTFIELRSFMKRHRTEIDARKLQRKAHAATEHS